MPRRTWPRRLLTEARVEARRNLLALDSALAKDGSLLSAEERAELDAARARIETAVAGEDRDEINAAAEALETLSKPFAERRMDRGIREALSGMAVNDLEGRVGDDAPVVPSEAEGPFSCAKPSRRRRSSLASLRSGRRSL